MSEEADIDFEAEGLLEGTEGQAREARLGLLRDLVNDGATVEELKEAAASHRLVLVPAERELIGHGPRYTHAEVAERSGVDLETLQRFLRAIGVPAPDADAKVAGESDVEAARAIRSFREAGLPEEGMLQVARAIGMATARVAQANRELIAGTLVEPGDDEHEIAMRLGRAARDLTPLAESTLAWGLNIHLLEQIRREVIGATDLSEGGVGAASEVSVCFADLVGFTKLGEDIEVEKLGAVASRLEEMATSVVEPPVRLVKLIGDAAMLSSPEPEPLLRAALRLVGAADEEGESFPQLRAGAAIGIALGQAGDVFGRPVNLASRITGIARPGTVLASGDLKQAADDAFRFSFAGERKIKGLDVPVKLFRVRDSSGEED